MAEEEARDRSKRSERRDLARNARRDPPVIEGQAQDVTPAADPASSTDVSPDLPLPPAPQPIESARMPPEGQMPAESLASKSTTSDEDAAVSDRADPTPLGEGSSSQDFVAEVPQEKSRTSGTSLLLLGFVVLAAGILYLLYQLSSLPPDNSATVADLKSRLSAIESRPATDAASLNESLARVERETGNVRSGLDALGKRVDTLAGTIAAQPNVAGQIADLKTALADQNKDLGAVTSSVAALPRPDIGRIEARIGDLDQRISGLQGAVSSIPHLDLGPLTGKVDALESRLKPIEAEAGAARSPEQLAQRRAAPVAVTAQAIAGAIDAGQAFPRELQALQALGVDAAKLAPLRAVAENGAPSLRELQGSLAEMRDRIVTQGTAPASGSYVDRLVAGASSLVQVRPLGSVVGDTPSAIVARMNDDIGNDDLTAANAEWHKLPDSSQSASKGLADRINLRLDAERAARDIAATAIEAMASPRR